jgi:hypothetical protein
MNVMTTDGAKVVPVVLIDRISAETSCLPRNGCHLQGGVRTVFAESSGVETLSTRGPARRRGSDQEKSRKGSATPNVSERGTRTALATAGSALRPDGAE